jgi:PAS domain S-box-containing protein
MHRAAILVVEDDKSHALLLGGMLERHGYTVCGPAISVKEASDILAAQTIDLVLMNIQLAGSVDGVKAATARSHDHQVPVVLLGDASCPEQLLDLAAEVEPYGLLTRPVREEHLLSTITFALFRHGRDRALRQRQRELLAGERQARGQLEAQLSQALTEKARAQQQLNEQQRLQLSLVENIPLPVFTKDKAGRYLLCNSAYKEFFGRSDEEIIGLDAYAIHPPDLAGIYLEKDEELLRLGTVQRYETKIRNKSGEFRDGIVQKALLRNEDGEVFGLVGTILDITERNRAEEEKKRLQTQLLQAQKMEAIGTLAGGIAHDFNNILGAIIGYAEMVRDDSPLGSTAAHDLDQILLAGNRAKDLVMQILAFSRQSEKARIPLQPATIIKETIKLLRASLPTTIAIKTKIVGSTMPILADPVQFHQLVMNLCTNAFHAMEEKGGVLTIALANLAPSEQRSPPGEYAIQLTVADNGVGIAPEIKDKIFDPYFTTKGVGKGTGMGLSIVHGIVTAHGGTIACQSRPGEGTTFTITLPALSEAADILDTVPSREAPPPGAERILFVDDEDTLVHMTRIMLERLGYQVTAHHSSREALAVFAENPQRFDVVITDQTMPGMTGLELAQHLLALRPELPIILCSGFSSAVSEEMARSAGIRGFAAKPLIKKEIGELIRSVLDHRVPQP